MDHGSLAMDARWRIELLGGLRAAQTGDVDGRVISRFRTQKSGELLAYLACHLQRAHGREELIELLWPECDLVAGRNRLSNVLSSLRHQLEPPGVPAGAVLQTDRAFVRLNPAVVVTDVAEFEAALQSAASASSHLEQAQFLTTAIELYRGPLLPGYYADWLPPEQERLAALHLQALLQLGECFSHAGEPARALEYARRAVAADPLREETHRELMRLYLAAGQPAAALKQYHQLEELLKEELGAAPALATRALAQEAARAGGVGGGGGVGGVGGGGGVGGVGGVGSRISSTLRTSHTMPLPTGTVTFLFTDIEGSTAVYERAAEAYREALASHHALLRGEFRRHGGHEVKEAGDSFLVAFAAARDALEGAVAAQRRLTAHTWPEATGPLRVRMAIHTGDVALEEGEYRGLALHRASRMLTAAHGGQILCSEAAAALLRRDLEADLRLVDLGVYRLRDVPAPERLFQVAYPEMPQRQFPPLRAEAGIAGNLPPSFSRFFGREAELAALTGLLATQGRVGEWESGRVGEEPVSPTPPFPHSPTRLVTLTGPGGTGKTRLALETARHLAERFSGAVWFVPLAEVDEAERLPDAALAALRLPRTAQVEPLDQLVEALGQQPSLLVLDNFEQLAAKGATLVQELLARAPSLQCLVTSRQRLDIAGEREFPVQPLPRPGGGSGGWAPEQLLAFESVQLFTERAQLVKPDFQVTPANAAALAELCDRLEGIPLAVELAAARAQLLTPTQMLAQLAHRFDFLVSRRRDVPERQRTLRGAVDWSYQLLSLELQRFFARLSIFRGGWSLEAAEEVCGSTEASDTLDLLAELRDSSLVLVDEAHEGMRFRMLETLREYAAEKLAAEEAQAVRRRHVAYYLALAEAARDELRGPQQAAWLARLDLELPNLRAALEHSIADCGLRIADWGMRGVESQAATEARTGSDLDDSPAKAAAACGGGSSQSAIPNPQSAIPLRLAGALWRFWSTRGYSREGLEALRDVLGRVPPDHPSLGRSAWRAEALNGAGALAHDLGDYAGARQFHEESLALWGELGDPVGQASALNNLGNLAFSQGEGDAASDWYEEALRLYRAAGDLAGTAPVLSNLGALARERGDTGSAAQLVAESLELRRALGDQFGLAVSLENLGHLERERGNAARAAEHHTEALALRRELDHKQGIAVSLNNLGALRLEQGDPAGAKECFRESLALLREIPEPRSTAECLAGLAGAAAAEGRHPQAARLLGAVAALRERSGITPTPEETGIEEQAARSAQAALGEDAYSAAWEHGRRMAPDQVAD
jgi:predicted ATPase/DNA-binding SARP family transcriptional activator/class 3 adenylate cyclase